MKIHFMHYSLSAHSPLNDIYVKNTKNSVLGQKNWNSKGYLDIQMAVSACIFPL